LLRASDSSDQREHYRKRRYSDHDPPCGNLAPRIAIKNYHIFCHRRPCLRSPETVAKMPHNQEFRFLPEYLHRQEIYCPHRRGAKCDKPGIESLRRGLSLMISPTGGLDGRFGVVMDIRFAFTLAQLLVGGYMFGACLVVHAQAQQPLYTPGPRAPTAPGSSVPPPVPTAPSVPPTVPTVPGSSVPPPANEQRSAPRTHKRTSVAKTVHHRGRSIVAARTPPYYWRISYWDPSGALLFCPVWNYPYDPDRCQWQWVGGLSGP